MNFLKYLSFGTLACLFTLIFFGGYVSASGVGLSCPDWPLCPAGLVPLDEFLIAHDFRDSDETAQIVKTVGAEEHAKGMIAHALPDTVTGTARHRRRRSGRGSAFDQYATAQIGGHGVEGHRIRW